jgi:hypothetical protein
MEESEIALKVQNHFSEKGFTLPGEAWENSRWEKQKDSTFIHLDTSMLYLRLDKLIDEIARYTIELNPSSCPVGEIVCWDNGNRQFTLAPFNTLNWDELIEKGYIPLTTLKEYHYKSKD